MVDTNNLSRNPYHNEEGKPELKPSVLLLMDILGYTGMAKAASEAGEQQSFVSKLYKALVESRAWLDEEFASDLKPIISKDLYAVKSFTDNIVIGFPISRDGEIEIGNAMQKAAEFQFTMARNGFFVRGAISVGQACVDETIVAGDALLDAYEAETLRARDPRIILTETAKKLVKEHLEYYPDRTYAPQAIDLLRDADGQWFVSYLEEILIAEDEHGPFFDELARHKAMVEERLQEYGDVPPIFAKYAWVAGYHNSFCGLHEKWFGDEHRINTDLFRATPRSILDN